MSPSSSRSIRSIFVSALVFCACVPQGALADTSLFLSPVVSEVEVGNELRIAVLVDSGGVSLNAIEGTLRYDPARFRFLRTETSDSILNSWTLQPTAYGETGELLFAGMTGSAYDGTRGQLLFAYFEPIAVGEGEFVFDRGAAVHAADGSGANVLTTLGRAAYRIIPSGGRAPGEIIDTSDVVVGEVAGAVIEATERTIVSSTHPDPERWYSGTSSVLSWKLNDNVAEVRMGISDDPDGSASVRYIPPVNTKTLTDLEQGVSYFHLLQITNDGSGTIEHFAHRVDSVPPAQFSIELVDRNDPTDPNIAFFVVATDTLSGIDRVEFALDGGTAAPWTDDGTHRYVITGVSHGTHKLEARAFDRAGNMAFQQAEFTLEGIAAPSLTSKKSVWKEGELVKLEGTAPADTTVTLTIARGSEVLSSAEIAVGDDGTFSWQDTAPLDPGMLVASAIAIDSRGATSDPSQELSLEIAPGLFGILARHPVIPTGIGLLVLFASIGGWFFLRHGRNEDVDEEEPAAPDLGAHAPVSSSRSKHARTKIEPRIAVPSQEGKTKSTTGLVVTLGARTK